MLFIVLPDIAIEDQLLSRAQQDDADALREIYTTYFPPVFRYIRLRVANLQEAEDLTGDVFLKLITAFRGKNPPQHSLRGWLFRVARNVMYDHYGKKQHFSETMLDEWIPSTEQIDPEVQFIRSMSAERARDAILQLKLDQQEVVILRFAHMLSMQETAAIMGKSVSSIKSLQFRALNNLRRTLEGMRNNG
jgi:RNA polymerase sigma-70 factor (ECF subfamily)